MGCHQKMDDSLHIEYESRFRLIFARLSVPSTFEKQLKIRNTNQGGQVNISLIRSERSAVFSFSVEAVYWQIRVLRAEVGEADQRTARRASNLQATERVASSHP